VIEDAVEAEAKADGKFHPRKLRPKSKIHAQRVRVCKRCGVDFDPHDRNTEGCRWHTGRYLAVDENGVVAASSSGSNREFERRAQHLIKSQNRKKNSKKARSIVFGAVGSTGVDREDGICWQWTCCKEESLVAPGCVAGAHS